MMKRQWKPSPRTELVLLIAFWIFWIIIMAVGSDVPSNSDWPLRR